MYLKQGHRLHNDKYRLLNILGEGGFSLTYRGAWKTEAQGNSSDETPFIPVCIKEYFFKDHCFRNPQSCFVETNSETGRGIFDKNKEKIIKEARILSEIHHPNVVNVLEVFKQNNTVYIVMEFISGHSLKHEVGQNGVFTEEKLKKITYTVGQALDYIHKKNILHLDIKPSNILMDENNNPKLIDFGISKKYDLSNDQETSTTLLAASKGYASIEQYDSEGIQVFSPCPDIYSLGATMYYLITGQVPTESILRSTKGLQNPREINPDISEETENVILKAMALNASDRYQSVMELLTDLGFDPAIDKIDIRHDNPETSSRIIDEPYDFDEEDRTQYHFDPVDTNKQKKEEYDWLYIAVPLLVSILLAIVIFGGFGNKLPVEPSTGIALAINPTDTTDTQLIPSDVVPVDENSNNTTNTQTTSIIEQISTIEPTPDPEELKRENYRMKYEEAVTAFNQEDFDRSRELFNQAEFYMETDSIKEYRAKIEYEIELIEIQKERDKYEIHMKFGIFDVAMRKSDELWGVIDDKGEVKIPCEYLRFTKYGGYGFFLKDDNSYDKYDQSGELIIGGVNRLE